MGRYLLKRFLIMVPTLLGILVISFFVIRLAPGDPASQKFGNTGGDAGGGMDAARGTETAEKQFRERHHFDKPLVVQFGYFLLKLCNPKELIFFQDSRPIWGDLGNALWVTMSMNLIVFVLIYILAIPLGILSAVAPRSLLDNTSTLLLFVLYSLPVFWVAELLRMWLSDYFPIFGLHSENAASFTLLGRTIDYLHHVALPVVCQTYSGLAYISRQMRSGMLEVIRQDYIRTAVAKGCGPWRVVIVHALRNSLFPIITLFASLLPFLVGGSVIVEVIFNIEGMGKLTVDNVFRREYDFVMTTLMLSAVLTLLGILLSDILYVLVNPQVRFDER